MTRVFIHGRYSDERQNETSIDNQVRNCKAIAHREGWTVNDEDIYCDLAVTGRESGIAKRDQLRKLMDAWHAGLVDVLIVNELSRLTRDAVHGTELMRLVEKTGVVVLTGDSIDTRRPHWQLQWMMLLTMAGAEVRSLATRTTDSMFGVLERGGMIGAPPFGFLPDPTRRPNEKRGSKGTGARWVIHEPHAELVREMYRRRKAGMPHYKIAAWLNQEGIPTPRNGRDGAPSKWRQATVHRLLSNTIYRGTFSYNGSSFTRAKLKRMRRTPEVVEYSREQFRLVDDDTWFACNPPVRQRLRAGVRHVLVGLLRCGDCGNKLALKFGATSGSASCPVCAHAYVAAASDGWMRYTSVRAATVALNAALTQLLTGTVLDEFRARLKSRLEAPSSAEEAETVTRLHGLKERRNRLLEMGSNPGIGREGVEPLLVNVTAELKQVEVRLAHLRRTREVLSPATVRRHLSVDVTPLLNQLLEGKPSVHEARAVLSRIIQRMAFVERPGRGISVFEVTFIPGAVTSAVLGGDSLDQGTVTFRVRVVVSRKRDVPWHVQVDRV